MHEVDTTLGRGWHRSHHAVAPSGGTVARWTAAGSARASLLRFEVLVSIVIKLVILDEPEIYERFPPHTSHNEGKDIRESRRRA
jgi:hypothetical protein